MDTDTIETQSDSLEDLRNLLGVDFPLNSIVRTKEVINLVRTIALPDRTHLQFWILTAGWIGKVVEVKEHAVMIEIVWIDDGIRRVQVTKDKVELVDVL